MAREMYARKFEVGVVPRPKGRPLTGRGPGGRPVVYTPAATRQAERDVIALVADEAPAEPIVDPVEIELVFRLPVPSSWPAWKRKAALLGVVRPTSRPDLDNLEKLLYDSLGRAGYWRDDSQIVASRSRKTYSERPGTEVYIRSIPTPTSAKEWRAWWER